MRYLGTLLAVVVGVPILRYSYMTTWRPDLAAVEWVVFIGVLVLTVHLVIAVHEVGHIAGGQLVGFRFRLLVIGPLRIVDEDGRIRVRLNRNLLEYAGVAGSSPGPDRTPGQGSMRTRTAIVHAAGPLLSLVAGGIALALLLADAPDALIRDRMVDFTVSRALALFAAGSLAVGIITLMPGGTRSRPTDGSRILELLDPPAGNELSQEDP